MPPSIKRVENAAHSKRRCRWRVRGRRKRERAAETSSGKMTAQRAALQDAKTRLLATTVAADQCARSLQGDEAFVLSYWSSYADSYSKDFDGHFISDAKAKWPDPYGEVLARLETNGSSGDEGNDFSESLRVLKGRLEQARDRGGD